MVKPKTTSHPLPRLKERIWRPTAKQVEALDKLKAQRKAVVYMEVAKAYQVVSGLQRHGFVTIEQNPLGPKVRITNEGRALLKAAQRDPSLIRAA